MAACSLIQGMANAALESVKGDISSAIQTQLTTLLQSRELGIKQASCGCTGTPWESDMPPSQRIPEVCPRGSFITGTFNTLVSTVLNITVDDHGSMLVTPKNISSTVSDVELTLCPGTGGNFYNQTDLIEATIVGALNTSIGAAVQVRVRVRA